MNDECAVFEFEKDFAQSLRCIPMSVRLKLDCVGVKVSLRQWNRLATEQRGHLLELRCDGAQRGADYRKTVLAMVRERAGEEPESFEVPELPEWRIDNQIPEQLRAHMATLGLTPVSAEQWAALGAVRRFALLKLSRPGHRNGNFVPALQEFGLLAG